jgi:hypothetical protein
MFHNDRRKLTVRWSARSLRPRSRAAAALYVALAIVGGGAAGLLTMTGIQSTQALFSGDHPVDNDVRTARIFRGEHDTPAFIVTDSSSGSAVDVSSPLGFAGDGRFFTSYAWATSFSAGRYLELDLNAPLPGGLDVTNGTLAIKLASDSPISTACYYVEVRRQSNGAVLSSHGSAGSPLECVAGTTFSTLSVSLAAVDTTDIADDLRVRIYSTDTGSAAVRIDRLVVSGDTPYSSFTLYPVLTRDAHDGTTDVLRWGLAGT